MRMKMKKLICTWRARLRVAPGPRLVPPADGPGSHAGPRAGGHPAKDGHPGLRPGHGPVSWLSAGASLLECQGRIGSVSLATACPQDGGWGRPATLHPSPRGHGPRSLTRMARKTGKRRIHQKPMLSLLVQHLQWGLALVRLPRPRPGALGVSSESQEGEGGGPVTPGPSARLASPSTDSGQRPLLPPRTWPWLRTGGAEPWPSLGHSYSLNVLEPTLDHCPGDDKQHGGACGGQQLWSPGCGWPAPSPSWFTHPSRCPGSR